MRRLSLLALTVSMTLLASSAGAAPSPEALAQGTQLHNQAGELLAQGKYKEAAAKYLEAYSKNASPNELFNAGRAEMTAGRKREALKLFRTYLALPSTDRVTAEFRKEAEDKAAECQAALCAIDVRGADESWVDGEKTAGVLYVEPGSHEVMMQGHDPNPKVVKVTCAAKETKVVPYDEGAQKGAGGPVTGPRPETEKGSWVVPGVLAGVGVVALGVGLGLGAAASSKSDSLSALPPGVCADPSAPACTTANDQLSSGKTLNTVGVVSVIGGAAFLGGAVVALFVVKPWETRERKTTSTWLSPSFGGGAVGLMTGGSF